MKSKTWQGTHSGYSAKTHQIHHELADNKRGRHRRNSFSVSITLRYRAIYTVDGDANVWYWIGSHSDYKVFTGKK